MQFVPLDAFSLIFLKFCDVNFGTEKYVRPYKAVDTFRLNSTFLVGIPERREILSGTKLARKRFK